MINTDYANLVLHFGGAVKALGKNRFGGHGVLFSDAAAPDLEGEFFTDATSFWLEDRVQVPVMYGHGMDKDIGRTRLGTATFRKDAEGVWFEGQLEARSKYVERIMELIRKGKLGFSTAAVLSEKVPTGVATWIKVWPIYELSLTPTPAEPRTRAVELKHFRAVSLDEVDRRSRLSEAELLREESDRLGQLAQDTLSRRRGELDRWTDYQIRLNEHSQARVLTMAEIELKEAQLDALIEEGEVLNKQMQQAIDRRRADRSSAWRYEGVRNGHLLSGRYY